MNKWLILFIPFVSQMIHAQQEQQVRVSYRNFDGGLNTSQPPHYIAKNESPKAKNWLIDERPGSLIKRKGLDSVFTLPSNNIPLAECTYVKSNGTQFILISDGPNIYQTTDFSTYTVVISTLNSSKNINCRTINDELWITNGIDTVFTWNGSSITNRFDGVGTDASVPRGKFILFEKNRVFLVRTSTSPSSVFYSFLNNQTDGSVIAPSSSSAWNVNSEVFCGRNDGSAILGAIEYRGIPFIFKENSIWKIIDIDDANIGCIKVVEGTGARNGTSFAAIDGLLHFWGTNGVYKFDGVNVYPIHTKILGTFSDVNNPSINFNSKSWDTGNDFSVSGTTLAFISTQIVSGVIAISSYAVEAFADGDFTSNPIWTGGSSGFSVVSGTLTVNDNGNHSIFTTSTWNNGWIELNAATQKPTSGTSLLEFMFISDSTNSNVVNGYRFDVANGVSGCVMTLYKFTGNFGVTTQLGSTASCDLNFDKKYRITRDTSGNFKVYQQITANSSNYELRISATDNTFNTARFMWIRGEQNTNGPSFLDNISINQTTGTWISEPTNTSPNNGWQTFDTVQTENGGTINWSIRTADTQSNLATRPFNAVAPGQQISTTSTNNTFVQFQASFTATGDAMANTLFGPEVDKITANWSVGGDEKTPPTGIEWERRYLVSVATGTNVTRSKMLYYAKPPYTGWMEFQGFGLNQIFKFQNNFYGLSSSTNVVYRLFNNSNDDGVNIDAEWQTKDETLDLFDHALSLQESFIDYDNSSGSNFNVGFSTYSDGDTSKFNDKTVTISGNGRGLKRFYHTLNSNGNSIRFHIRDNSSNAATKIYGLDEYLLPFKLRIN